VAPVVRKWLKLRYCLIPYLIEQSEKVTKTGYPLLRALVFHHPHDKTCWHISDQYYFGDHFLVAPVMNPGNERDVYLPEGTWVNFFTGRTDKGGTWLSRFHVPPEEMPVWVKMGAEIPVYPFPVSCTDEMDFNKVIRLRIGARFRGIRYTAVGAACGFDKA
jgi:alpha-D-xyloside xylohydrolase